MNITVPSVTLGEALTALALNNGHIFVETALVATILFLLLQRSYKPDKKPLTEKEIDQLCEEWTPEPLIPSLPDNIPAPPVLKGMTGARVELADGSKLINLVSQNFLGLATHPTVEEACRNAIDKYGVGSCGPRGFYGTIDVHVQLEEALARHMGTDEAIIFSYDMLTIASSLPAFSKRGDLLVVDEGCNFAVQNGVALSRSEARTRDMTLVRWFKHNDVEDLKRVLEEVKRADAAVRKPLNRRFIVVEGVYSNYGDIAPLKEIVELKNKYCYRLAVRDLAAQVDESIAFGALPGPNGRGACDFLGIHPQEVDMVTASMGTSLGSVGGFCAGEHQVIEHQRINASGYCFSASLPPYLSSAAMASLEVIRRQPELRDALAANAAALLAAVSALPGASVTGAKDSPLIHLRIGPGAIPASEAQGRRDSGAAAAARMLGESGILSEAAQEALLLKVCDRAKAKHGVLIATAKYSPLERQRPPPSIRITVSAEHTKQDIEKAAAGIKAAWAAEVKLLSA